MPGAHAHADEGRFATHLPAAETASLFFDALDTPFLLRHPSFSSAAERHTSQ